MKLLISLLALLPSLILVQMGIGALHPCDIMSGQALGLCPIEIDIIASGILSGFCLAGCYTLIGSWLQVKVTNEISGRVLSLSRFVDHLFPDHQPADRQDCRLGDVHLHLGGAFPVVTLYSIPQFCRPDVARQPCLRLCAAHLADYRHDNPELPGPRRAWCPTRPPDPKFG